MITIKCQKVSQTGFEFLVGTIKAQHLIPLSTVTHRAIIGFDEEGMPLYNKQIQRKPSSARVKSIRDYLINDKFATFPNNILISVPSILLGNEITENGNCGNYDLVIDESKIDISDKDKPLYLQIFDGQHRFAGIMEAISECKATGDLDKLEQLENFEFIVSFFIDAEIDLQAMLFSIINRTPVKVTQDLVFDLFGLSDSDSPQKTALAISLELNGSNNSPFYKRIRLIAKREKGIKSPLSQGMFVKTITTLISPTINDAEVERFKSRDKFKERDYDATIFRSAYANGKDYIIYKTIENFFNAVRDVFVDVNGNSYWDLDTTPDNAFHRTIGFLALIKTLVPIYKEGMKRKDLSREFFRQYLSNAAGIKLLNENGESNYEYSSVGVNKLKDDILNLI
ncbi:DGQHR domain-containing protein [Mucilaginibacter sp. 14171R-50]|uniref:DGQHR domain-containing protein n=1 Tax=Mucilaginibacter sp. 14171R-50 TaxID=2703789 RepID=UPI00138B4356|nr:DGQHR domain-containing protein [Mucilaginibacter sp. 14171R-50]QHS55932.1 DGQHR domain-containing protein [Mucilaginibacter sp. 14171R-50]